MFRKSCKRCGVLISGARNLRFCTSCKKTYVLKESQRQSRYTVRSDLWEDRELISYSLGFGFADGAVCFHHGKPYTVRFVNTQKELIQDLTKAWGYDREISLNREFDDHRLTCWENIFYSNHARKWVDLGFKEKKEDLTIEGFDVELGHFLRGLCDGDGTISKENGHSPSVRFLGQEKLLASIQTKLTIPMGFVQEPRKIKGKQVWQLEVGGYPRVRKLLGLMYQKSSISLSYKKDLAMKYIGMLGS